MSSLRGVALENSPDVPDLPGPPYIGALLRIPWQAVQGRMLRDLHHAGFDDLVPAHWSVLQYPGPDGVRPMELAARANITKQAANYLIAQLEARGYLERRTVRGKGRLVFLTPAGHRLRETLHASVRKIEADLSQAIGPARYRQFRATLERLPELTAADRPPR